MRASRLDWFLGTVWMGLVVGLLPLREAAAADLQIESNALARVENISQLGMRSVDGNLRSDSLSLLSSNVGRANEAASTSLPTASFVSAAAIIQPADSGSTSRLGGASTPLSFEDWLLSALIGMGLIVYQLCRKHRMLRPHPFGI